MAKIRAHGAIIGTVEYIHTAKRYMADGAILQNKGFGWKLYAHVKPHLTPQEAYDHAAQRLSDKLNSNPQLRAYRAAIHNLAALSKRWRLATAIQMMPDDCDGVWSECCDSYGDNVSASVDEIADVCKLFKAFVATLPANDTATE
jgi:hypothetical protein